MFPLQNIYSVGDGMNKNIIVNFVFPPTEEEKAKIYDNINQFNREIILAYINNLNCDCEEKERILGSLNTSFTSP